MSKPSELAAGDHIESVRVGGIADNLAIDLRAARPGPFQVLKHQDPGAAGDHEAVAGDIIGPAGHRRPVVEAGAHGPHGVEQDREGPVQLLGAAGEDHVLVAQGDLLIGGANAVGGGRAGRRDRIVEPADLEPGRQDGGDARAHGLGDSEGTDPLGTPFLCSGGGLDDRLGGGPARADDQAGHLVGHLGLRQAGVGDGLLHGDVAEGCALGEETGGPPVDGGLPVQPGIGVHLAAEAKLGVLRRRDDPRPGAVERSPDIVQGVADG